MDTIHLGKNSNGIQKDSKISFTGYRNEYNAQGKNVIKFYAPPYDKDNYDISLELFDYESDDIKNKGGQWQFEGEKDDIISPKKAGEKFKNNEPFEYAIGKDSKVIAYRFALKNKKDPSDVKYMYDSGNRGKFHTSGKSEDFNVLFTNVGTTNKSGPMYHIFPDSYGILKKDGSNSEEAEAFRRNHFNKAGGNIQNIINELNVKDSQLDPYGLIISTPLFGGDEVSSHGYWTANPYQISSLKGNVDDFKELINVMFDKGKGYVADGAFTSQTFEGAQLSNVLKWGRNSEFAGWFKLDPNPDSRLKPGVLPDKVVIKPDASDEEKQEVQELKENLGVRIVNPKNVEGYQYDKTKPTYMQFYDKRMVTDEELQNHGELIKVTHKPNPDNSYDVVTYEDSVQHFFELDANSEKLTKLPKDLLDKYRQSGTLSLEDIEPTIFSTDSKEEVAKKKKAPGLKEFFSMKNYQITNHSNAGGSTCWDGSADLIKLNLSMPDSNEKSRVGNVQAKNYMYNVAKFWTNVSAGSLLEHISNNISKNMDDTLDNIAKEYNLYTDIVDEKGKKTGEKNMLEEVKTNVLNGTYESKILTDKRTTDQILKDSIADFPFESIEFATDLVATLSTSYISPRPTKNDTQPRSEIVESLPAGSAQRKLYTNTFKTYVNSVLTEINKQMDGKLFEGNDVTKLTDYGKYVTKIIMPDVMKFGVVTGLFPNVDYKDTDTLRNKGLLAIGSQGVHGTSEQDEAEKVLSALNSGISKISPDKKASFAKDMAKKFSGVKLDDLKLAEAVMDKTEAGLNWRFDAAKDVGDLDKTRAHNPGVTLEKCWDQTIDFWKNFIKNVKDENNSAYTIAEVTNIDDFFDWGNQDSAQNKKEFGKYVNPKIAERMFYEQTGATTGSNFSIFFNLFPSIFGQSPEHGTGAPDSWRFGRADGLYYDGLEKFLKANDNPKDSMAESLQFINQNHIFTGNHDKPRPLHAFAVDMEIFLADKIKTSDANGNLYALYNNSSNIEAGEQKYKDILDKNEDVFKKVTGGRTDLDKVSCMAVAVGDKYFEHFDKAMAGYSEQDKEIVHQAIIDLVNGTAGKDRAQLEKAIKTKNHNALEKYLEKARAFGDAPFEVTMKEVMKQAQYIAKKEYGDKNWLSKDKQKEITDKAFDSMMKVPLQKMSSMWEMMCATVGIPTLYAGDELAQTGYEWPTKNGILGNRNLVHHDWLNKKDKSKQAIQEYNNKMMQISHLHKDKTRNLSALADGDPTTLVQQNGTFAIYKNNYKGSGVITVFSDAQFDNVKKGGDATEEDKKAALKEPEKSIKKIPYVELTDTDKNEILPEGTVFKKLRYDKNQGKYVDDGKFYNVKSDKDGKHVLVNSDGSDIILEGTTNIFYKTYESNKEKNVNAKYKH